MFTLTTLTAPPLPVDGADMPIEYVYEAAAQAYAREARQDDIRG